MKRKGTTATAARSLPWPMLATSGAGAQSVAEPRGGAPELDRLGPDRRACSQLRRQARGPKGTATEPAGIYAAV